MARTSLVLAGHVAARVRVRVRARARARARVSDLLGVSRRSER